MMSPYITSSSYLSSVQNHNILTETIMKNINAWHTYSQVSIMMNSVKYDIFEIVSDAFNFGKKLCCVNKNTL